MCQPYRLQQNVLAGVHGWEANYKPHLLSRQPRRSGLLRNPPKPSQTRLFVNCACFGLGLITKPLVRLNFSYFDMSTASVNFFAALDSEAPKQEFHTPVEKKSTSSKKVDRAPAKADPSRARPKKQDPNGNNAAFKDKAAGRTGNKKVDVGESATAHSRREGRGTKTDRQNKSGKRDTGKKIRQGWGDDKKELDEERAAAKIAAAERAAEEAAAFEASQAKLKTLDQFLSEKAAGLKVSSGAKRQPNEGADNDQWSNATSLVKDQPENENGRKKNLRQKKHKEVLTIDIEPELMPSLTGGSKDSNREGRGSFKSKPRGNGRGNGKSGSKPKPIDLASLPKLG